MKRSPNYTVRDPDNNEVGAPMFKEYKDALKWIDQRITDIQGYLPYEDHAIYREEFMIIDTANDITY